MNSFYERLREERKRLGINQTDFASIGGVKKLAQINYEKGKRNPDASYLIAIANKSADIQYILTGIRSVKESSLTQHQLELLNNYQKANEIGKKIIEVTAIEAAKSGI